MGIRTLLTSYSVGSQELCSLLLLLECYHLGLGWVSYDTLGTELHRGLERSCNIARHDHAGHWIGGVHWCKRGYSRYSWLWNDMERSDSVLFRLRGQQEGRRWHNCCRCLLLTAVARRVWLSGMMMVMADGRMILSMCLALRMSTCGVALRLSLRLPSAGCGRGYAHNRGPVEGLHVEVDGMTSLSERTNELRVCAQTFTKLASDALSELDRTKKQT